MYRILPIMYCDEMVRAILENRKTQTRRIVKAPKVKALPLGSGYMLFDLSRADVFRDANPLEPMLRVPFAHPKDGWMEVPSHDPCWTLKPCYRRGDLLWVREGVRCHKPAGLKRGNNGGYLWPKFSDTKAGKDWFDTHCFYTASMPENLKPGSVVLSKMFMPRWASRIDLEVTGVRVERVNEISINDCIAEGVEAGSVKRLTGREVPSLSYATLWELLNGEGSWAKNPWVWVYEFRRLASEGVK